VEASALFRANRRFILSRIRTSSRKSVKSPKLIAAVAASAIASAAAVAGSLAGLGPAGTPTAVAHTSTHAAQASTVISLGNQRLAVATHSPSSIPEPVTLTAVAVTQRQAALRTAWKMLGHFGWGHRQWAPLYKLWNRESSWNKYARNPYSGAYGIPQAVPGSKMASAGRDWRTNATTQIRWGMRYIKSVYGYPRRAWYHELDYGWY
jgi:resuscitation-promoting factor RpfB